MSGWGKGILVLSLLVFITTTGAGIVAPLLPLYAASLGASSLQVGAIFASFSFSRSIFVPIFGRLSDLFGRKPFLLAGLLIYSVVSFLYILRKEVHWLIWIRFGQGLASAMVLPVAVAYAVDISKKERLGLSTGIINSSMYIGLSFGPVMGGLLEERFGMPMVFTAMGASALLGLLFCLILLPGNQEAYRRNFQGSKIGQPPFTLLRSRKIISISLFRLTYTIGVGILWAFLPLYAQNHLGLGSSQIGIVVMVNVLVAGCLQIPMGILSDRGGKVPWILLGGFITLLGLWGIKGSTSFNEIFLYNALVGMGGGVSMPALMSIAAEEGKSLSMAGLAMGVITFSHSLGMLIGPLVGGIVLDTYGFRGIFDFMILLNLAGLVIMALEFYRGKGLAH